MSCSRAARLTYCCKGRPGGAGPAAPLASLLPARYPAARPGELRIEKQEVLSSAPSPRRRPAASCAGAEVHVQYSTEPAEYGAMLASIHSALRNSAQPGRLRFHLTIPDSAAEAQLCRHLLSGLQRCAAGGRQQACGRCSRLACGPTCGGLWRSRPAGPWAPAPFPTAYMPSVHVRRRHVT